jgi:hypothetical protein
VGISLLSVAQEQGIVMTEVESFQSYLASLSSAQINDQCYNVFLLPLQRGFVLDVSVPAVTICLLL